MTPYVAASIIVVALVVLQVVAFGMSFIAISRIFSAMSPPREKRGRLWWIRWDLWRKVLSRFGDEYPILRDAPDRGV